MKGILKDLNKFWFGFGDPTTLAVFRILAASVILANLLLLRPQWTDFYTDRGFVDHDLAKRFMSPLVPLAGGGAVPRLNLLGGYPSEAWSWTVLNLATLAALLTVLGLGTRIAAITLAVLLTTIHHRGGFVLYGGDTVMRNSAIYLALAPCGLALSLDRLAYRKKHGLTAEEDRPVISMWPQRLIQYNLALIYFTTTWAKWYGTLWKNGTATWYPARLNEFKRLPVPSFFNEFPMVTITTYGTLFVEFALGVLVWFRAYRKWVLLAGLLMHGYIEWSMNVPLFAFAICSMYVTFYEGDETRSFLDRVKKRLRKETVTPADSDSASDKLSPNPA